MQIILFFVKRKNLKVVILVVYVDDIVSTGDDDGEIFRLKSFQIGGEIKDLGLLKYFLGIEVARPRVNITKKLHP